MLTITYFTLFCGFCQWKMQKRAEPFNCRVFLNILDTIDPIRKRHLEEVKNYWKIEWHCPFFTKNLTDRSFHGILEITKFLKRKTII